MEKGMAIIERDEVQTKSVFIDHETIEFARQNARTKKRIADAKVAKRKAEKEKARRMAYAKKIISHILFSCAVCGGVTLAGMAGLVAPIIWILGGGISLCAACTWCGVLFGKVVR